MRGILVPKTCPKVFPVVSDIINNEIYDNIKSDITVAKRILSGTNGFVVYNAGSVLGTEPVSQIGILCE